MSDNMDITRRDFLKFTFAFAVASSLPLTARSGQEPELGRGKLTILSATGAEMLAIDLTILEKRDRFIRGTGDGAILTSGVAHTARLEVDDYPVLHLSISTFPAPGSLCVNTPCMTSGDTFVLREFTLTDDRR